MSSYPNQYVGGLSPKEKARKWKPKKWFKIRHIEDMCCPNARFVISTVGGGETKFKY